MKKILAVLLIILVSVFFTTACNKNSDNSYENFVEQEYSTLTTTLSDYSTSTQIVLSNENLNITKGGYYSLSGTMTGASVIVNTTEKVFIELNGVNITNSSDCAFNVINAKEITLTLREGTTNTITDGGKSEINAALFTNDTLIIEGNGTLTVTGNNEHGIEGDDDLIINGGVINITAVNDGMHVNDNITINGGNVNILNSVEGIESKVDIVINNGLVCVSAKDDGLNATSNISINGGRIYSRIINQGDGIDSNGTIDIRGGITVTIGTMAPENGIDCDNNTLSIYGGTLIAIGGGNSSPTAASDQNIVLLGSRNANSILHIESSDGEILTFSAPVNYSSMLFTSSTIKSNTEYKIYNGGTVEGGTDFYGFVFGGTYTGGTQSSTFTTTSQITNLGGNSGMGPGGGIPGGNFPGGGGPARP